MSDPRKLSDVDAARVSLILARRRHPLSPSVEFRNTKGLVDADIDVIADQLMSEFTEVGIEEDGSGPNPYGVVVDGLVARVLMLRSTFDH